MFLYGLLLSLLCFYILVFKLLLAGFGGQNKYENDPTHVMSIALLEEPGTELVKVINAIQISIVISLVMVWKWCLSMQVLLSHYFK